MAVRFSTGFRNSFLGNAYFKGTELAYGDGAGAGAADIITDDQSRFLTAGVKVGDLFTTAGSTTAGNNIAGTAALTIVAAGTVTFAAGTLAATEDFIAGTTLTFDNGGSFKELFDYCVIGLYSGTQPATPDATEGATLLALITVASGAFTGGVTTNGLRWGSVISGVASKNSDVWSGVGLSSGTVTWGRLYENDYTTGASTTAIRIDFGVATSGTALTISDTSIVTGATTTVDTATFTFPAA